MKVVLGCGNFGGIGSALEFFGQGESREQAFAIMDAAWALGLRSIDTADAYGGGRSETWIGEWMRATGNRPRLTTKTYNPMEAGGDHGLSRDRVLRQVERSLERFGVDRIDVYLTHEPDPQTPIGETFGAFEELVAAGTIGAYGVSNVTAEELREAVSRGRPALVQNSFSLLDRGDEDELIPLCAEHGIAYQAFSPLAGGWLAGKYRRGQAPPPGSRMTLRPEPYLHLDDEHVYGGLEALERTAADRGVSTAGLALAWLVADARVDSFIVGPRRPEHLDPVREALGLELSPEERDEVGSHFVLWQS